MPLFFQFGRRLWYAVTFRKLIYVEIVMKSGHVHRALCTDYNIKWDQDANHFLSYHLYLPTPKVPTMLVRQIESVNAIQVV
jgi:hypothetical protein